MPTQVRAFVDEPAIRTAASRQDRRLIAFWLFGVAGMIFVMIVLGGATRLTGSGLSIMEWAPLSGIAPPMSDQEWQRLFALYQQIPQYHLLNAGLNLQGFKEIFWLEWVHRLWGRLIGLAVIGPLVWFGATGRLPRGLWLRLFTVFVLGGLQGAVGWIMVASGFFPDSTSVSPYRLVVHLGLALILYAAVLWTALSVLCPESSSPARMCRTRLLGFACLGFLALTLLAGGFVAGTHAGLDYNTFPLMEGKWIPPGYDRLSPFLLNLTENIAAVQFNHRLLATATALLAMATVAMGLSSSPPRDTARALAAVGFVTIVQYTLGVLTLINLVPAGLAVAHQAVAIMTLTTVLVLLHHLRPQSRASRSAVRPFRP